MHCLIVDDEALARSRLRRLLGDCNALPAHSCAEAAFAGEALALLKNQTTPLFDVVLLDIHMPGQDGLALAHELQALPQPPAVIFVTAHADHAVDAFALDATDYLTKPVRLERLQTALAKVQRKLAAQAAPPTLRSPANSGAAATLPPGATPQRRASDLAAEFILIQDRGRSERVPLAEVLYFKAELKYITVRTASRSYVMDGSLNELEVRHGERFLRIHRNALVARHAMRAITRATDATEGDIWLLRLQGLNETLPISRRQTTAVRQALEQ